MLPVFAVATKLATDCAGAASPRTVLNVGAAPADVGFDATGTIVVTVWPSVSSVIARDNFAIAVVVLVSLTGRDTTVAAESLDALPMIASAVIAPPPESIVIVM